MLDRFLGSSGRSRLQTAFESQFVVQGNSVLASMLCDKAEVLEHKTGTTIIIQDACDDCIHLILSGRVAIRIHEREIAIRAAGTHVGEMALIDPTAKRNASVVAMEPTVTAMIRAGDFCEIANNHPAVWRRVAVELGNRLRERSKYIKIPNTTPVVFLGSSTESVPIIEAVVNALKGTKQLELAPWTGDLFWPSDSTIEDLENRLSSIDFAVLVFGPDDKVTSRMKTAMAPRDNVLFECGMCFGAIGRKRTYIMKPRGMDVKFPSDLLGINTIEYEVDGKSVNISKACASIKRCVKLYGSR